ncbi:MAG: hypothetical protein ACYC0P_01255 [Thiobacillus sp.]
MLRRDGERLDLKGRGMLNVQHQFRSLSHAEALHRWCRFTDSAIGGVGKPIEVLIDGLVSAGATEASLKELWLEVRHLSWVSIFGESPWKTAAMLGAALDARDHGDAFENTGNHYVESFGAAVEKRRLRNAMSSAHLKPYRVMLYEKRGDKFKLAFDCDAVEPDDAAEQAEREYPGCEIISCTWYDYSAMQSTGLGREIIEHCTQCTDPASSIRWCPNA